jgi:hypothetical protein
MIETRKPYRTSYERLVEVMQRVDTPPGIRISQLKGATYNAWLLGKELGFIERRGRMIVLTGLGRKFLDSNLENRKRLFRSGLERVPAFSSIWNRILGKGGAESEFEIKRETIVQVISEVTGTTSENMLELYTVAILNLAASAGLVIRLPHKREGVYRVLAPVKYGDITAESGLDQPSPPKAVEVAVGTDYLDKVSLLVYDILRRSGERDRHMADLGQVLMRWSQNPRAGSVTDVERRIIVNELNYALETRDMKAFDMVAETLGIIRGEKRQKRLVEFEVAE